MNKDLFVIFVNSIAFFNIHNSANNNIVQYKNVCLFTMWLHAVLVR